MGVHSGKFGNVHKATDTPVVHVRNWSIDINESPEIFVSSNTQNGQFADAGVVDVTGSFEGFGGAPGIFPGETITFEGYTAPSDDVKGTTGQLYTVTALINSLTINWDWGASQSLNWSIDWGQASGALVESLAVNADDTGILIPEKMCGLKLEIADDGAGPSYSEIASVTGASLTITANNQAYNNSTTISGGVCYTYRKAGTITWSGSYTEQEEGIISGREQGTRHRLRMYTSASAFWLLEYAHLTGYSNFTVDRESGAIISKSANWVMAGSDEVAIGSITDPATTVKWP